MLPLVRAAHVCRKLYSQTYRVNIRLLNAGEKWASRCAFSRPCLRIYGKIKNRGRNGRTAAHSSPLQGTEHLQRLLAHGLERDVDYCLALDVAPALPVYDRPSGTMKPLP